MNLFRLLSLLLAAALAACSIMEVNEARETEQLLAAAGFRTRLADTPERFEHVESLTQFELVPHEKDGKVYYVYADAVRCRCVYWGTEEAYQAYQRLASERALDEERRRAARMNEDAAMNWELWGTEGWWMY
jgi:hypothetical protein